MEKINIEQLQLFEEQAIGCPQQAKPNRLRSVIAQDPACRNYAEFGIITVIPKKLLCRKSGCNSSKGLKYQGISNNDI